MPNFHSHTGKSVRNLRSLRDSITIIRIAARNNVQIMRGSRGSKDFTYIFHHIPKCGGTSINQILDQWFYCVKDYRIGWTDVYPKAINVSTLTSQNCLCGHFELPGFHLHERYPEVVNDPKYRIFTFVRDPFDIACSLYRYETLNEVCKYKSLESFIENYNPRMQSIIPFSSNEFKTVMNRYFFVGILEKMEESIEKLSSLIGKSVLVAPRLNETNKSSGYNSQLRELFEDRSPVEVDFYTYCLDRFKEL